jgi:hypothetical protein
MSTDLEAAVARLKRDLDAIAAETPGAREARGDVRLLLADWQRLREELADALDLRNGSGPTALSAVVVERDAARAEVERLCDWASKVIGDDGPDLDAYLDGHVATPNLARLRERDARVREAFRLIDWMAKEYAEAGGSGGPEMRTYNEALALLKETP